MSDDRWWNTRLGSNFAYDYERFARNSFVDRNYTREHRRAIIRILTHYIEGGMTFPDVRLGYGQEKIHSILDKLDSYMADFGTDETVSWAIATVENYLSYHAEQNFLIEKVAERLSPLAQVNRQISQGGSVRVTKSQIEDATNFDFRQFLLNRHSVRQYRDEAIDDDTIKRIIRNARECSSVCNRQTTRAYAFNNYDVVQELLTYQAGNSGFREEIRTLFIITANMQHMNLVGERFQGWIDGGIFAQTLALSIHAEGLGACFLNWSVEKEVDLALRKKVGIPDGELVITFMSAGHLKDAFRVPVSARKPVEMILSLNPPLAD